MKTYVVVLLATVCASCGEALVSVGMKEVGDISIHGFGNWFALLQNPRTLLGMLLMACFFALYSTALSWADLSFVQPLTALIFVFGALIARFFIGETVSVWRWAGIALIVLGVCVISRDPHQLTIPTK